MPDEKNGEKSKEGKKQEKQMSPMERISLGYRLSSEEAKKSCQEYIKKCTAIAQKAKQKLDKINNPENISSFEDGLSVENDMSGLRLEFRRNMASALKELRRVSDRDYANSTNRYFYKLNEVMQIPKEQMAFPSVRDKEEIKSKSIPKKDDEESLLMKEAREFLKESKKRSELLDKEWKKLEEKLSKEVD